MNRLPMKIDIEKRNSSKSSVKSTVWSIVLIMTLILSGSCSGNKPGHATSDLQNHSDTSFASIEFKDYTHDFGKVPEGEKIGYTFVFENKGKRVLVISSAVASCGCTVPKHDAKPVPPGGTGTIEVVFDTSGRRGKQTKTVTVRSNASKPVVLLQITAEVISEPNK